ncbi:MAG: cellulase family glycosylhydrolase [Tannerellaceae bacterium]|jgi:hypothetical protein|nr:cellulase family glycosylhydrolase [Tannerellaceae bacterium]
MKKFIFIWAIISLMMIPVFCLSQETSPFGVAAHLQSGEEHLQMPQNLHMIREAGIGWMRTDFSWSGIESPQGTWHFDHLDRMVDELEKADIRILGLLLFSVDWANPAYRHLDAWLEYVERTVTRYKGRVRHWEIWNEPNLTRFWDTPGGDPVLYTRLLEVTYKKIKEIDPQVTVLYAGTAGIPYEYLEQSFEAGAGHYFDLLCIHPYRPFITSAEQTVQYYDDIERLRALMAKYRIDKKKIWITEMGVTTMAGIKTSDKDAFREAREESGKDWKVAVVSDEEFPVDNAFPEEVIRSFFPDGYTLEFIPVFDLKRLRPDRYDAVFFPPTGIFPLHINLLVSSYLTDYLLAGGRVYYYTKEGTMYIYDDARTKVDNQAVFLGQTLLLSLRFGIERYFWYEFQSPERNLFDREDNFGLVHRELEPKPSYYTYSTLGKLFPEGSTIDRSVEWQRGDGCFVVSWTQKDNTRVWAAWSPGGVQKVGVKIGKGLRQALDHLGRELPVTEASDTLELSPGITYLVGPVSLDFKD